MADPTKAEKLNRDKIMKSYRPYSLDLEGIRKPLKGFKNRPGT